jgi:hypothetical protein
MVMARTNKPRESISDAGGFTNWLNNRLRPYIGPPPLGPYNEEPLPPASESACPLCGQAMSLHTVDRSGERTQLYCPTSAA